MKQNRIACLDLIRTIAILTVCLNHSISSIYVDQTNYEIFNNISIYSKFFMIFTYILSRLGVPLFLFLTGVLILSKNFNDNNKIKKFYKSNLISLLISIEIWNTIYYFINLFISKESFNVVDLSLILLFMKNSVYGHMWYMPMIIGMYIFLPYVSMIVKRVKINNICIPLFLIFVTFFVLPPINEILEQNNFPFNLNFLINLSFSGAQYGLYIILGYYIYHKGFLKNLNTKLAIFLIALNFIISMFFQSYLYINSSNMIVYYNFFGVLIFSSLTFMLIVKANVKNNLFINYISKNSLAIYFLHYPILIILSKFITINLNRPILTILFYILSLIFSIICIEIMKKNKTIKKYLLRL